MVHENAKGFTYEYLKIDAEGFTAAVDNYNERSIDKFRINASSEDVAQPYKKALIILSISLYLISVCPIDL